MTLFPANLPSPSPISTITAGIKRPEGIWVDGAGTLYVANSASRGGAGSVTVYRSGSQQPSLTLQTSYRPMSVVTDSKRNVYVGSNDSFIVAISEYAPGSSQPRKTVFPTKLTGVPFMGGLAVDAKDNLSASFFVYANPPAHVVKFAPGLRRKRDLQLVGLAPPNLDQALARDGAGNLYVGGAPNGINIYAPGSKQPSRTISGGFSQYFTVSSDGSLYDPADYYVFEFAPGAQNPDITFKGALQYPVGAAIH